MQIADYIDADLLDKFEFRNYNHAIEIITQAFPEEWREVVECLRKLDITTDDLREAGGNETKIPKKFDDVLTRMGGEKSGFLVTYTSSFIQDKPIKEDAFPAFPLRSV